VSACHFNGERTYKNLFDVLDSRLVSIGDMLEILLDCHGHDFRVEVEAIGVPDERGILVLDEDIEKEVMRWNRTNISCLPEYMDKRRRATTEAMAADLATRLRNKYDKDDIVLVVRVWETDEICATITSAEVAE
jgi:6-pyruvoyl-tetrahydropterin synthase